jgi:hypothetical protein
MNLNEDIMRPILVAWREAQHLVHWHQWETLRPEGGYPYERCTWCGTTRA